MKQVIMVSDQPVHVRPHSAFPLSWDDSPFSVSHIRLMPWNKLQPNAVRFFTQDPPCCPTWLSDKSFVPTFQSPLWTRICFFLTTDSLLNVSVQTAEVLHKSHHQPFSWCFICYHSILLRSRNYLATLNTLH